MGMAFAGIVLLTALLLGSFAYLSIRSAVREDIRQRILNIATLAAQQVDPAQHRRILSRGDEVGAEYREIKRRLRAIRDGVGDVRFVYTLRRFSDGRIRFVMDAEESGTDLSHVGDIYESASAALSLSFESPYRARVAKDFDRDSWGVWLSGYAPILNPDGSLEAVVGVDISAARVLAYEKSHFTVIAVVTVLVGVFAIGVALLVSKSITEPLLRLERDMARIQNFDLRGQSDFPSRILEVVAMRDTVNNVRDGLRSFRRYVPADLVSELIRLKKKAVLDVEKRPVTVFFSDIARFTSLCEGMEPHRLMENLGEYLKGMTEIIHSGQGTVDKYIGDGIMAFWGAPKPIENHAVLACRAALRCQAFLDGMVPTWHARGIPPLLTRIGVNTGEVLVGNVGYEERLNYTVMGDPVNVASRIEALNKLYRTRTLISESTWEAVRMEMEARLLGRVAVKGRDTTVAVYELVGEKGALPREPAEFCRKFSEAMALYFERRWAEAARIFEEIQRHSPDDEPCRMQIEECRHLLENPPPSDWNGVTVMKG